MVHRGRGIGWGCPVCSNLKRDFFPLAVSPWMATDSINNISYYGDIRICLSNRVPRAKSGDIEVKCFSLI